MSHILLRLCAAVFSFLFSIAAFGQTAESDRFFEEGMEAISAKDYPRAVDRFRKSADLDAATLPEDSPRANYSSCWLAYAFHLSGNYQEAFKVSPLFFDVRPDDRRLTKESDAESDLVMKALEKGDVTEATRLAEHCLQLEIQNLGELSINRVGSHIMLADLYYDSENPGKTLEQYDTALEILKRMGIENSVYNFRIISSRGYLNLSRNMLEKAREDAHSLLEIAKFRKDKYHDESFMGSAEYLLSKIESHFEIRNYQLASEYALHAFDSFLRCYSPEDEDNFNSLIMCADLLESLNQSDLLILRLKNAFDEISRKGASDGHKGIILHYLGNAADDEEMLRRSLDLLRDPRYSYIYYMSIQSLGHIVADKGRFPEAMQLFQQTCDHYVGTDTGATTYRNALMSLGDIKAETGDYKTADELYVRLLSLLGTDKKDPDYILASLKWFPIHLYRKMSEGFKDQRESFDFGNELGKKMGECLSNLDINKCIEKDIPIEQVSHAMLKFINTFLSNPTFVTAASSRDIENMLYKITYEWQIPLYTEKNEISLRCLASLAHVKYLLGNGDEAISLMEKVISTKEGMGLSADNLRHDLAYYQYDTGYTREAFDNFETGYRFNKNNFITNYRWMTLSEREDFTRMRRGNIDNIPHYAAATPDDPRYARLAYDALLFSKGLLLNSTMELSRLLREEGDGKATALLDRWREANINYLNSAESGNPKAEALKETADSLERELLRISRTYGDYTDGLTVSYRDVQKCLGEKDVAIEFFSYQQSATSRMYGALLLRRDADPVYIKVGSDRGWKENADSGFVSPRFFNRLFSGMKSMLPLRGEGKIYFAADGALHSIAIENQRGAEEYDFRRLSSTREIALKKRDRKAAGAIAIYGGIKYGVGELAEFYEDEGPAESADLAQLPSKERASEEFLEPLPATALEADEIRSLLDDRIPAQLFTGDEASEKSLKNLSGKHTGLLHVATHGFFHLPDEIEDHTSYDERMMLSTGLYFAGAQNTLYGFPFEGEGEDGILTSREISLLDLRGMRLAVLSACETARGGISPDGVFGLQRGFKQAGAESILMSLWKVDDAATRLLMKYFYTSLLDGSDPYEALNKAKEKLRFQYPDPRFWAAFIIIDAITPLSINND